MRTFARVDLGAVRRNYRAIRNAAGAETAILAVVKADAYGHGAVAVAAALASEGADKFAVACIEEGIELRRAAIAGEIAILGGLLPGTEPLAAEHSFTPFIQTAEQLRAWQRQAELQGGELACHLEVDSGMTRTGLSVESARGLAELLARAPNVAVEGIATHLASAENFADSLAEAQIERFSDLLRELAALGIRPRFTHHANSAAIAYGRITGTNMVRPGLALFGYVNPPVGAPIGRRLDLEPALEWKGRIVAVRYVAAGAVLGYDATYRAERPMRIGVVSVGYGDGLDRRMSNGGIVLAGASECPIAGLISMDVTLVDLSNAPGATPGDDVTLIGKQRNAWRMAERCGTIPYEVLCGISKRVPRLYG
jgi:alanine racemase